MPELLADPKQGFPIRQCPTCPGVPGVMRAPLAYLGCFLCRVPAFMESGIIHGLPGVGSKNPVAGFNFARQRQRLPCRQVGPQLLHQAFFHFQRPPAGLGLGAFHLPVNWKVPPYLYFFPAPVDVALFQAQGLADPHARPDEEAGKSQGLRVFLGNGIFHQNPFFPRERIGIFTLCLAVKPRQAREWIGRNKPLLAGLLKNSTAGGDHQPAGILRILLSFFEDPGL